ncbi:MAG: hypothetical protein C4297_05990 [Gemmataceae bacterium]
MGCAIAVVVTQNIVRAAVWLLFTLGGVAGLFFLLGADFVGATQIMVYVGGTLVLIVFGVMLTAQSPFVTMRAGAGEWGLTLVVGGVLVGLLAGVLFLSPWTGPQSDSAAPQSRSVALGSDPARSQTVRDLGLVLLGIREVHPNGSIPVPIRDADNNPQSVPRREIGYLLPFELASVHLVVVLVAAAYLARARRRTGSPSS